MQGADSQLGLHGRPGQHHRTAVRQTAGGRGQRFGGPRAVRTIAQPDLGAPVPKPGQERATGVQHRPGHVDHVQHGHKRRAAGSRCDGRVQRGHQPVRFDRGTPEQRTGGDSAGRHTQEEKLETCVVQLDHQNPLALQVRVRRKILHDSRRIFLKAMYYDAFVFTHL